MKSKNLDKNLLSKLFMKYDNFVILFFLGNMALVSHHASVAGSQIFGATSSVANGDSGNTNGSTVGASNNVASALVDHHNLHHHNNNSLHHNQNSHLMNGNLHHSMSNNALPKNLSQSQSQRQTQAFMNGVYVCFILLY